jgi:hypothetical protein
MTGDIQVGGMLELVPPEYAQTIRDMLAGVGKDGNLSVDEFLDLFPAEQKRTIGEGHAILYLIGASNKCRVGKYAPKLSFQQRCEVLGLYKLGYTRESLSRMYGVDRRTITHVYNQLSPHYKNVRVELLRMGQPEFLAKYITDEVRARAQSFVQKNKEDFTNKNANRKAGTHVVRNSMCKYDHRVIVGWVEAGEQNVEVSGWYYRDLDSEWPDAWFTAGGPESLRNSQACYSAMMEDIADKI